MRRDTIGYLLAISLLFNAGAVAAVAWQTWRGATEHSIASSLKLDALQRERWAALEQPFVAQVDADWRAIARQREVLIREVFAATPDAARIEAARAGIAQLQAGQQRRVIAQLLRERELLTEPQRAQLADLLLRERQAVPRERQLHGR
jgi:Spy/CpxP family protein refolding chaperone